MFELSFDLGPLHFRVAIGDPAAEGGEYVDLAGEYETVEYGDPDEMVDRLGFRGA